MKGFVAPVVWLVGFCLGVAPVGAESLADRLVYRGVVLNDPAMTSWCASPFRDEQGKWHLFVSRWPSELKVDPGWRSHSEIAHFTADSPTGPFTFRQVALAGTHEEGSWEKFAPHNPLIRKYGETYALVYIARAEPGVGQSQRIGIATSKSLDGPWLRSGKPVLSPSEDAANWTYRSPCGVNNPALIQMPDGRFFLYFKAMKEGTKFTRMGLAIASKLEGPYVIQGQPVTGNDQSIEDGCAYVGSDRKVHLITTDNHGILETGGGLEWVSEDGLSFGPPTPAFHLLDFYVPRQTRPNAKLIYGNVWKLERPGVYVENGEPRWIFAPSGVSLDGDAATEVHLMEVRPGKN